MYTAVRHQQHIRLCGVDAMHTSRPLKVTLLRAVALALFTAAAPRAVAQPAPLAAPADVLAAAQAFVQRLDEGAAKKALMPFEGAERYNFHFIPRPRKGLPLQEMTLDQRRAAHALLRSALSSRGYLKATSIIQLEQVLDVIEDSGPVRDPELYFVSVFGTPTADAPWGWRFEGHHLSLNYTSVRDELTATTPAFFGANPAEVRTGPSAGLRVLAAEEDLARALMRMLDGSQRARATIAEEAPHDIVTGADRHAVIESFEGLPAEDMTAGQRAVLIRLVEEYARNLKPGFAERQLERIRGAGIERLYFAWAGSLEPGRPHYYRIHGPTVLFEYDNTQNDANHVHTIWRDLENDFGEDMLKRHYEEHAHD